MENKFFVRTTAAAEEVKAVFGDVKVMDDVVADEIGFVTEKMTEAAYKECAAKLNGIVSMIRVEG